MTKQRFSLLLLTAFGMLLVFKSTAQSNVVLDSLNIEVEVNVHNEILYIHTIQKKETLYSLSRFFNLAYSDLLQINNLSPGQSIQIGSQIKIPIRFEYALTDINPSTEAFPIIYKVKRRETLFKLSHVYFPQSIQALINRNNVKSFALQKNQPMIVGWWPIKSTQNIPDSTEIIQNAKSSVAEEIDSLNYVQSKIENLLDDLKLSDIVIDSSHTKPDNTLPVDSSFVSELEDSLSLATPLEIKNNKGIAYWNKSGADYENLFVMHNNARENSYIKLTNPLTGREVVAKVIMQIPAGIYSNDIDIVITPAVAKSLGALDSRFRIKMEYYE
ncbi:MAG: LysM peptidoglycan-binding domain-containing protein [Saprospiraceae bacterium]|nr:LysM peptidoglycan-binding domain-containing protein [Saprospiraceae bacterium]